MQQILKLTISVILLTTISGCSLFYGKRAPAPRPTRLTAYKPSLSVKRCWLTSTGVGGAKQKLHYQAAVAHQEIFTVDDKGDISANRTANGRVIWQKRWPVPISSSPATGAGLVFFSTNQGELVALKQANGKLAWKVSAPNEIIAAPVTAGHIVVVKTIDGVLVAYNSKDGKQLWRYNHGTPVLVLRAAGSPTISGNVVVAGFADGKVAALDLQSGQVIWEHRVTLPQGGLSIEQMVDIDAKPVVANGVVYVVTFQGKLAALDLASGHILWQRPLSSYTGLAVDNGNIYVADAQSRIWIFDKSTGHPKLKIMRLRYRQITAPILVGNAIVVGDAEGYLHFFARDDGRILNRIHVARAGIVATPIHVGNKIYVTTNNGSLAAYTVQ